jgi:hypothetical protein
MLSVCAKIFITIALCLIIFSLSMVIFSPQKREKFEEYSYSDYDRVIEVYNRVLKRAPDSNELSRYTGFISSGTMTTDQLEETLKKTDEYLYRDNIESSGVNNSVAATQADDILPDATGDRKVVEDTFMKIISRPPSMEETDKYYDMYIHDFKKDTDLLEDHFRSSAEYQELVRTNGRDGAVRRYNYHTEINNVYREILRRDAFPNELTRYSPQMMSGVLKDDDLREILKETPENKSINASVSSKEKDLESVKAMYAEVMLQEPTSSQAAMYYNKYVELGRDDSAFIAYLKKTPEYKEKMASTFTPNSIKGIFNNMRPLNEGGFDTNTNTNTKNIDQNAPPMTEPVTTSGPKDTTSSTNETESVDKCASNTTDLATLKSERNMEELMYGCKREKKMKKYTNATDDMVLLEGAEWSVPQERPPICYQPTCIVNPSQDQTALIGTILGEANETQIGSILPKFTYKEATDV